MPNPSILIRRKRHDYKAALDSFNDLIISSRKGGSKEAHLQLCYLKITTLRNLGCLLVNFIAEEELWHCEKLMDFTTDALEKIQHQAIKITDRYRDKDTRVLFDKAKIPEVLGEIGGTLDDLFDALLEKLMEMRSAVADHISERPR